MKDANTQIIEAIRQADEVTAAGRNSLLAIAARTIDPRVKITKQGLADALGFHPCLVVATLVTADLAGDPVSRRDLAESLFSRLTLQAHPPELTPAGRRAVTRWCLEQLQPVASLLAGALERALDLSASEAPAEGALLELAKRAQDIQRCKVVPQPKGMKATMGIEREDRVRRRAGQAIYATTQGLRDRCSSDDLCVTVAGEVAGALCENEREGGVAAGADFCVGLAGCLEGLTDEQVTRRPGNGG
jgi:hypothetical protein